jgi:hypothetical protein
MPCAHRDAWRMQPLGGQRAAHPTKIIAASTAPASNEHENPHHLRPQSDAPRTRHLLSRNRNLKLIGRVCAIARKSQRRPMSIPTLRLNESCAALCVVGCNRSLRKPPFSSASIKTHWNGSRRNATVIKPASIQVYALSATPRFNELSICGSALARDWGGDHFKGNLRWSQSFFARERASTATALLRSVRINNLCAPWPNKINVFYINRYFSNSPVNGWMSQFNWLTG